MYWALERMGQFYIFLGDFNGRAVDRDDVVGMFWEDTLMGVDLFEQSKVT